MSLEGNNAGEPTMVIPKSVLEHLEKTGDLPPDLSEQERAFFANLLAMPQLLSLPDGGLNFRAWRALERSSEDWVRDLVALLRSDVQIHSLVRAKMADVIEGRSVAGTRLELIGGGANRDRVVAIETRRKWVEIGDWIENQISKKVKRKDAIPMAAECFGASVEKCDHALTYTRRFRRQLKENGMSGDPMAEDGLHAWDYLQDLKRRKPKKG